MSYRLLTFLCFFLTTIVLAVGCSDEKGKTRRIVNRLHLKVEKQADSLAKIKYPPLDTLAYDSLNTRLANGDKLYWPVKNQPYPLPGAILPFKRIVAFYGNTKSARMGILGQLPPKEMVAKLDTEATAWSQADPKIPVQKAMHLIVMIAQADPGQDSMYRLRHAVPTIDSLILLARQNNCITFIDLQVGLSTIQKELPQFADYLKMPDIHLAIDPEFSMKTGAKPGTRVGSYDADDINYASGFLRKLVQDKKLPPKILIVHRYTKNMVTGYQRIRLQPEVQLVMDMDGWGGIDVKTGTYNRWIYQEPVQFTGFKLFYKNDKRKPGTRMMTPDEILKLKPAPSYIQYQ